MLNMPLATCEPLSPDSKFGLWKIEEDEAWFLSHLHLSNEEHLQLDPLQGHRRLEFLASRTLVHLLTSHNTRIPLEKDRYGKPHLNDMPFSVSISHSRGYAAAILGKGSVGIDIQHIVGKIERIAHKFMREEELESILSTHRLAHLHVYWCAKEALYKAYGKRQLDFCNNIIIPPFPFEKTGGRCSGYIQKDNWKIDFQLHYQQWEDYMVVSALASE